MQSRKYLNDVFSSKSQAIIVEGRARYDDDGI